MSSFNSPETGDFDDYFMTTTDLIDRFVTGNLWGWGRDNYGQLGDNSIIRKLSPVQTVGTASNWKFVSIGSSHTSAIKTDGTLWTFGYNDYGQLGTNSIISMSSPVQTTAGGNNWKQVSIGGSKSTIAIKTDGTLWGWGNNGFGNLGDNTTINRSSPIQIIIGSNNWKQVSVGYYHASAIKTDGTLWTWGYNSSGRLGNNSNVNASSPVQTICGGTNWKQVSTGYDHTAAIKTDGTLWAWGVNTYGQLGNNSLNMVSSPVQIVIGSTTWKDISCGFYHTAAIKTDGSLWVWGSNNFGQLGLNTFGLTNILSPVQTICGGNNWKSVSCGYHFTSAIKTDGTLWGWGANDDGQLGDNTTTSRSSPVQTVFGGDRWKTVINGYYHIMALQFSNGIGVE